MSSTPPDTIGRYRVLQRIGHGGMGTLYLARDPAIDRDVAIKLLREGRDSGEMRDRFTREARSAGGLRHINIVTIFDVGEHEGQPFIAMEYVRGETLSDLIRRQAPLSLARKLQIMDELCAGLQYAHRAGVVHRDVKPGNLMIDEDGVLKILDFGIARVGASGMTQTGVALGTLNYMAPEQMEGTAIDARADMFSTGAVFYELLSYQRAFPGDLESGILHQIISGRPEPLETRCPDLDPGLLAIVDRCLEKTPNNRFADLAMVRRELTAVRQRLEGGSSGKVTVPPRALSEGRSAARRAVTAGTEVVTGTEVTNRRLWIGGAAAAVIIIVGALAWTALNWRATVAPPSLAPVSAPVPTTLVLDIAPWATIDAIVRLSNAQRVDSGTLVTPVLVALEPGEYRVRARHPGFANPLDVNITVAAGPIQRMHLTMPGFEPEREVTTLLAR